MSELIKAPKGQFRVIEFNPGEITMGNGGDEGIYPMGDYHDLAEARKHWARLRRAQRQTAIFDEKGEQIHPPRTRR